jgi:hypothetical protein
MNDCKHVIDLHARCGWFAVYGTLNPAAPKGSRVLVSAVVEFFPMAIDPDSPYRAARVNTAGALEG